MTRSPARTRTTFAASALAVQDVACAEGVMVRAPGPNIILSPPPVSTADDVDAILGALDAGLDAGLGDGAAPAPGRHRERSLG